MIGIFDSGVGGLTVLKALRDILPSCDVIYFGDTKNAPYGSKSNEELSLLTIRAITVLQERGAKKIISACNSVSASLAVSLFDTFDIEPLHLIEMVGPTVAYFKNSSAKIMLCATPATVRSQIYQNAFRMIGKDIDTLAIPELAGAIESGKSLQEIKRIISDAFTQGLSKEIDVLILGCTHYPLVMDLFKKTLPLSVIIFDPALAVAERAGKLFWPQEVGNGKMDFLLSADSSQFKTFVEKLFPQQKYTIEVIQ